MPKQTKTDNQSAERAIWRIEREWDEALIVAGETAAKLQRVQDVIDEYKLTNKFARGMFSGIIRKLEQAVR